MKVTLCLFAIWIQGCAHFVGADKNQEKSRLMLQLAADKLNERDYPKALEAAQEAVKYDPLYPDAHNHLALVFLETKRYEKSEEAFKKALSLKPDFAEALNNLGVLYNRMEKYREAIAQFQAALSIEGYPTPENALTNMGYSYFKMGELSKAKSFHQKALDLLPQFCLASKNMADVYAKEKNYQKANSLFQKAVTHCPLYQEAQYKYGLTLMKLGQRNVAKAQFEKLVQRHKSGPYVERSAEVLKYLH